MTSFRKASFPNPFRKSSRSSTEGASSPLESGTPSESQSKKSVFSNPFRKSSSRRSSEDTSRRTSEDTTSPLERTSELGNSYTSTQICVTEFVDVEVDVEEEGRRKSEPAAPQRRWSVFAVLRRHATFPRRKSSVQAQKREDEDVEEDLGTAESRRPTLVRRDADEDLERLSTLRVIPDVSLPE